jgi:hypothetical protein
MRIQNRIPNEDKQPEFTWEGDYGEYTLIPGQHNPPYRRTSYVKSQDNSYYLYVSQLKA